MDKELERALALSVGDSVDNEKNIKNGPVEDDISKAIRLSMQSNSNEVPLGAGNVSNEDMEMQKALAASITALPGNSEHFDPNFSFRQENIPVGVKNVGNTCYFSSLIQVYVYY